MVQQYKHENAHGYLLTQKDLDRMIRIESVNKNGSVKIRFFIPNLTAIKKAEPSRQEFHKRICDGETIAMIVESVGKSKSWVLAKLRYHFGTTRLDAIREMPV